MSAPSDDAVEFARMLLLDARAELRTDPRLGPEVDAELASALRRLDEPLRVALAGTLKSGKSTLLNALVGEEIAPTDATECTRVVTWFARSRAPRVAVVRGGQRAELPIRRRDGRLALDLGGVPEDEVEHLEVGWPSSLLERYTVIDTPGRSSNSREVSARTEAFLNPEEGDCPADAVVYLMRSPHSSDLALLRRLHEQVGHGSDDAGGHGPLGVIGVLSRADELDGGDPGSLDAARRESTRLGGAAAMGGVRQDWIPVSGLLAVRGQTLRQAEFAALATLAALTVGDREDALLSPSRFMAAELPLSAQERDGLLAGFGLSGIRAAVELILDGATDAPALAVALVGRSGLDELRHALANRFDGRAGQLKAHSALRSLRGVLIGLARRSPQPRLLRMVDRALADTHPFTELRTLAGLAALPVPPATRDALEHLLGGRGLAATTRLGLPADSASDRIAATALAAARHWRAQLDDPLIDGPTRRTYLAAVRSCEAVLASGRRPALAP
jgi:hypothetical protein